MNGHGLGRRPILDRAPLYAVRMRNLLPTSPAPVERFLTLPNPEEYRPFYDQGTEGACVGFSCSWMMSILNRRRYDATKLYREAQDCDEYHDTPPSDGTSVKAALDILRARGHWRYYAGLMRALNLRDGIAAYRWALTVDELRAAISQGTPFVLGINWYEAFDSPVFVKGGWSIGHQVNWGYVRGGHAICGYGASDKRQAFRLINTWGFDFPPVWIPYTAVQRLLNEDGEAAAVTDR